MLKKGLIHLGYAFGITLLFFLPDLIYKLFEENYFVLNSKIYKEVLAFVVLNFLLLSVPHRRLKLFLYGLLFCFAFIEIFHFSFFHSLVMPYEIMISLDQPEEIVDTLDNVVGFLLSPFLIVMGVFSLLVLCVIKTEKRVLTYRFSGIVVIFLLLLGPLIASQRDRAYQFLPRVDSSSIRNFYNALSWVIGKEIPTKIMNKNEVKEFAPYRVEHNEIKNLPKNIIIVMGESLSSKRMSLFGYEVETTPLLSGLKEDPNFAYTSGFSGGVTTDVAIPTFFTLKREPENVKELTSNRTNLIKLAKERGYKTHYITTQELSIFGSFLGNYADVVLSKKDFPEGAEKVVYDTVLREYLENVNFEEKNFIILHQRNSHSPYDKYTPKAFYKYPFETKNFKEYMLGSYHNSVLFTDSFIHDIITKVKNQSSSSVLFVTSDHGEMLGGDDEEGRFGHIYLGYEDAKVPFLLYQHGISEEVKGLLSAFSGIKSHYEMGKLIAGVVGYTINNPNEEGTFFINGVDISGKKGYLSVPVP